MDIGKRVLTDASGNDHGIVGPQTGEDEPVVDLKPRFHLAASQEPQGNCHSLEDTTCDADTEDSPSSLIPRG